MLLLAIGACASGTARAAGSAVDESAFDPKRPLAAELELSVRDGFELAAVGDCIISHPLSHKRTSDRSFDRAVELLSGADAAFGNLETTILDIRGFEGHPESGADDWGLLSLPAVARDLAAMGFDLLARANNHALDWGVAGMRETSRWLDEAGLVHAGVGENRAHARAPRYFESARGRVALISFASSFGPAAAATPAVGRTAGRPGLSALRVERVVVVPPAIFDALAGVARAVEEARSSAASPSGGATTPSGSGVAPSGGVTTPSASGAAPSGSGASPSASDARSGERASELSLFGTSFQLGERFAYRYAMNAVDLAEILQNIRLGKQHADFAIATIHAHEPAFDEDSPGDFLQPLARQAIDAGADAFIVHGIHHLGPIEIYAGKPIFYGLANFFWSDVQEPLDPILREAHAERVAKVFTDPAAVTDADLTALMNATDFRDERTFQTVISVSRFERGRVAEIRLHAIDLGYGMRLTESGVPRVASPAQARPILERLAAISAPYGTKISIRGDTGVIRADAP